MKLTSRSFKDGQPIPARFAAGQPDGQGTAKFSDNLSPHLAWDDVPAHARSFVIICHDPDVPTVGTDVNQPGREVPATLPRTDFFHWLIMNLPGDMRNIEEGEFSNEFTPKGKHGPSTLYGAQQGVNDYTGWFAGSDLAGNYYGYDGPFPPWNDSIIHHYVFTVYALSAAALDIPAGFNGKQLRQAMQGHVLAQASITGTYTNNARLLK